MQVLIVTDSFKESLDAKQVAQAIADGVTSIDPNIKTRCIPFSDGGEGALGVLENHAEGMIEECPTVDALGRPKSAHYFRFNKGQKAWVELSQASGLAHIEKEARNPLITSTYGTGLLIKDAIEKGCKEIILGIGGSATNDGGAGIFQALDGQLLDHEGHHLTSGGGALVSLEKIIMPNHLTGIAWRVACDVQNPLLGPQGASAVYGPQKGASQKGVEQLEKSLTHLSKIIEQQCHQKVTLLEGGGAAGGTAAGMVGFFGAQLTSGFGLLSELIGLEQKVKQADLIFTAEGKIDQQSLQGKVPVGVARIAKKYGKKCIGLAGIVEPPFSSLYDQGFSGVFNLQQGPISLQESKENAYQLLSATTGRVFQFYLNSILK